MLFISAIAFSCKKYPENKGIIFQKKEKRLHGYWDISTMTVDNADSTDQVKAKSGYCEYPFNIYESEGGDKISYDCSFSHMRANISFSSDKKNLIIEPIADPANDDLPPLMIDTSATFSWNIQKLTKTELWLKNDQILGKRYYLKLKKKK